VLATFPSTRSGLLLDLALLEAVHIDMNAILRKLWLAADAKNRALFRIVPSFNMPEVPNSILRFRDVFAAVEFGIICPKCQMIECFQMVVVEYVDSYRQLRREARPA